jgi:DNA-directed RNA polymerase I, II, and III subunit RPABC2
MDEDVEGGQNEDPETIDQNMDNNIVESGDPNSVATAKKNTVAALKNKKIANADRKTTPYLTKYEKARILGTRALQIS